jgi:hypothetical protein
VIAVIHVPFLQDTFEVQSLGVREWVAVLGLSTLPLIIGEGAKLSGLLDRLRWERTSDA